MSNIKRSLALTSLFPASVHDPAVLAHAVDRAVAHGFDMAEFYIDPGHDDEVAALLRESGLATVLIAVLALKEAGYSLCAVDEAERARAVDVLCACIDRAAVLGARAVMINSGFAPQDASQIAAACESYVRSVSQAYAHIGAKGYAIEITLEPGDSRVQSFQLLGSTERVLATTQAIRAAHPGYALTMDVAHLREEGEPVMEAIASTLPYCAHIHLCNCLMNDPAHPLYGDKHVDFDCPGACFGYADFERMYHRLRALYGSREWIITLEILCRDADNDAWFDAVVARCSWLWDEVDACVKP